MSETGTDAICQYGIKIDLTDKKVGLWEANEAKMKRANELAQYIHARILKLRAALHLCRIDNTAKTTQN